MYNFYDFHRSAKSLSDGLFFIAIMWTYNNDRPNMGIAGITPAMKLKMAP